MAVINALTHGQLQTFRHVLQDLEAQGVQDLRTARVIVQGALSKHHEEMVKRKYSAGRQDTALENQKKLCPECQSAQLLRLPVNVDQSTLVDGEFTAVLLCGVCHYEEWIK